MAYKADCAVVLALLKVAFLRNGDDKRVHGMGHSPVCQTLLQILCKALITASPPACNSSSGILSIPGDFPFLSDFTVASTSSCKIVVSVGN